MRGNRWCLWLRAPWLDGSCLAVQAQQARLRKCTPHEGGRRLRPEGTTLSRATAVPLPTLYKIRLRWGYRLVQLTKRSSRSTKRSNTLKARSSGSGWVMSTPVIFSASSGYIAPPVLRKSR